LIAILLGWSLGEEPIHATTLVGAGLILGGVGLVRR
jgi:drug/metabolite transporter (DMT)-like permease